MKMGKKFLGLIICLSMLFIMCISANAETLDLKITNTEISSSIANEQKKAVFELSRKDISEVLLEYTINDEIY